MSQQPSIEISVRSDAQKIADFFGVLGRRHIPFAFERAFRKMGIDAQEEVRRGMPKRFTLRNKRVQSGIRYWYTKRHAWPKMYVEIGSLDDFMAMQETGGTKRPVKGRMLAVPTLQVRTGQNIAGRLPRRFRPKALMASGRGEIERMGQTVLMWMRVRRNLQRPAYVLTKQARLKPRFGLQETVEGKVRTAFGKHFTDAMWHAIKTATIKPPFNVF